MKNNWIKWVVCLTAAVFLFGTAPNLFAKGFGGGGGFRSGGSFKAGGGIKIGGGTKSFHSQPSIPDAPRIPKTRDIPDTTKNFGKDLSKPAPERAVPPPKPQYDMDAGKARQKELSGKAYDSWKAEKGIKEKPKAFDRGLAQNREQRMADTYRSRQPNTYYRQNTVIYRDHYDNTFMQYVTWMWLFHHWDTVDHSRFEQAKLRELEARVKELEAQGVKRDPNYAEKDVDPDLAYKKEAAYDDGSSSVLLWVFIGIVAISVISFAAWFIFIRRVSYSRY